MDLLLPGDKIGIDVDGTILDTNSYLIGFAAQKLGLKEPKKFNLDNMNEVFGISFREAQGIVYLGMQERGFGALSPIPGAVEGITRIVNQGYVPVLVSSRHGEFSEVTRTNIRNHFQTSFPAGYSTNHPHLDSNPGCLSKPGLCLKKGIKVMIEDSLTEAERLADAGIWVVLMDRENRYNLNGNTPDLILLTRSWKENIAAIDYISSGNVYIR